MLATEIQHCPRCGGAINRENNVTAKRDHYDDRFLHCEFCGVGWESSVYADGDWSMLDFNERTEPVQFGKFLQRLEAARVA